MTVPQSIDRLTSHYESEIAKAARDPDNFSPAYVSNIANALRNLKGARSLYERIEPIPHRAEAR